MSILLLQLILTDIMFFDYIFIFYYIYIYIPHWELIQALLNDVVAIFYNLPCFETFELIHDNMNDSYEMTENDHTNLDNYNEYFSRHL